MSQRVIRAGRNPYVTPGNKMAFKKLESGKLVFVKLEKSGKHQKCGDCKCRLAGIEKMRPQQMQKINKSQKTVNRAYGGNLCSGCVQQRILRSFLKEEQDHVRERNQ
jgi:large subunit ribosomal protein L34e